MATMADLEAGRAGEGGGGGEDGAVVPVLHVRRLTATLVDILRHVSHSPAASQLHHRGNRAEQVGRVRPELWEMGHQGWCSGNSHRLCSCWLTTSSPSFWPPPHATLQAGTTEITPQSESAGLLECGSESSFDDKLSLRSAATASSGGAATHALLRAAFVKDEYRGACCFSGLGKTVCLHACYLHAGTGQACSSCFALSVLSLSHFAGDDVKPFYADQVLVTAASRQAHDLEEAADKAAAAGPDAGETGAMRLHGWAACVPA